MTFLEAVPYAVAVAGIAAICLAASVMAAKASAGRRPVPPESADPLEILNSLASLQAGPKAEAVQTLGPGVAPRSLPAGTAAATLLIVDAAGSAQTALVRFPDEAAARAFWKSFAADLARAWPVRRRRFSNHAGRTVFVEGGFGTSDNGLEISAWSSGRWLAAVWTRVAPPTSPDGRGEVVAPVRDRLRARLSALHARDAQS